ncbi:plasmid pRiA4b ORF-3 family protein [Clostridium sp. FP2]|uniref:plasmid pRiA4b ORF-3 family protein n=1 Tax=Clostridium TaxID=1485 RepID=UPI0013E98D8C|nr:MULTISPECIES: plasmid pRiA4b ORF-3 family protein [Clostridium]MBW9158071.1 plasmid pRiA4b ORF-3 family protein [Clostridium tagluense]MBZ9622184.1 plasmid pRiA4b ORF-3 family protein [Clostridium sp. FP2]WLC66494.1 plasmid pRiA4b ORF-3 family protein [Clostridium tagluense]
MDLSICEENILQLVQDFNTFMEYIEEEKPVLSVKKEVLGKSDSFKLNSKLNFNKAVTAPNYNQDQYFSIDLMFSLAVDSGLYVVANDEKEKMNLVKTEKVELFLELNNFEKYVFIIENYWSKYDFCKKYPRWSGTIALWNIVASIAKGNLGEPILKQENTQIVFSTAVSFLCQLSYFGLCSLELIEGVKNKYEDTVKAIIPTELGIVICKKLLTEGFNFWNMEDVETLMEHLGIKRGEKSLFFVLKDIFPDNIVQKTIENEVQIDRSGVYTFKVSLSKSLWRKIRMSHRNTFEDLHFAIQSAFNFDNDHLYDFYIGGNRRTAKITYAGNPQEGIVDDITIGEASLYKGQKIKYIFDFGYQWEFNIIVTDIDKNATLPIQPEVIESKGQSPEQYPECY